MRLKITLCLVCFCIGLLKAQTITPNGLGIVYISENGSGDKSGSSWSNAAEIRPAFTAAKTNTAIQQLWIKSGTYYPTLDNDRQKYLEITRNIKVYGSFAGTENGIGDRDLQANVTTLSGNIGNVASSADNSYHLLVIWPKTDLVISDQTIIDGLTFRDANANSGSVINNFELPLFMGGAIFATVQDYNQKNYPVISRCKFLNNSALQGGAAIYYDGLLAPNEWFKIQDSYFENNTSSYVGGALMFFYDEASIDAGNVQQHYFNVEVANCTFKANHVNNNAQSRGAESSGGAICAMGKGDLTIKNSIFQDNTTDITFTAHGYATYGNGSGLAAVSKAKVAVYNSLFYGNNKAAMFNRESSLKLINSTVYHSSNELVSLSKATSFELYNSILWNDAPNTPAVSLPDPQLSAAIIKNSIINATPGLTLTSSVNVLNVNPQFVGVGNFMLAANSPAINAGDNALYVGNVNLLVDKDVYGDARLSGNHIDIGAVEYPSTLPVGLASFKVVKQLNGARLEWKTFFEVNNNGFLISRSGNGIDFEELAKLPAKGPGDYSWFDGYPLAGKNYYQLRQVDNDGVIKNIGQGVLDFGIQALTAYPNPATGFVNIQLNSDGYNKVALYNMAGQVLETKLLFVNDKLVTLDLTKFSAGTYLVKLYGAAPSYVRVVKR